MNPETRGLLIRVLALFLTLFICFTVADFFIENPLIHLFVGLIAALAIGHIIRGPLDRHIARTTQAGE